MKVVNKARVNEVRLGYGVVEVGAWMIGENQITERGFATCGERRLSPRAGPLSVQVADDGALLAQQRREISQLKAALLEGRGGMLIAADGSVLTAEEAIDRMRTQHEARVAGLEEQVRSSAEARTTALRTCSDLLQVCGQGMGGAARANKLSIRLLISMLYLHPASCCVPAFSCVLWLPMPVDTSVQRPSLWRGWQTSLVGSQRLHQR
jgi:hypothetical protein